MAKKQPTRSVWTPRAFETRATKAAVWTRAKRRWNLVGCCGCGLVHRVDVRVTDGRAEWWWERDDEATRWLRRRRKSR